MKDLSLCFIAVYRWDLVFPLISELVHSRTSVGGDMCRGAGMVGGYVTEEGPCLQSRHCNRGSGLLGAVQDKCGSQGGYSGRNKGRERRSEKELSQDHEELERLWAKRPLMIVYSGFQPVYLMYVQFLFLVVLLSHTCQLLNIPLAPVIDTHRGTSKSSRGA